MIPYLLHTALLTSLLYLAYRFLLKKETFFKLNRMVLVGSIMIAFLLPLIPIPANWSWKAPLPKLERQVASVDQKPVQAIDVQPKTSIDIKETEVTLTPSKSTPPAPVETKKSMSIWSILFMTYLVGVIIMGANLLIQVISIFYQIYTSSHIQDGHIRIVELDNDKAAFSFANCIFINPTLYDWDTYSQILEHERTHVEQGHSLDILLAEILVVIQWFNPFAWMLRKTVEDNLEFLTDEQMLAKGVDRESYQMNLLKVAVPYHPLGPSNNYNQSTLKNRISMMNIKKSSLSSSWKYLCVLALFGLSTVFFNPTLATAKASDKLDETAAEENRIFPNKGIWSAITEDNELCIKYDLSDHRRNNWWVTTKCYPSSDFPNLPIDQEGTFNLKRAAGTINFKGKFEDGEGLGRFTFTPDESFRSLIKKEGYNRVSDEVLFGFTLANIDQEYWAYLKQEGLTPKDEDDLEDIGHHLPILATLKQNIDGYKQLGFTNLSLGELVDLSIHNVSPDFIRSIQSLGFKNLDLEEFEEAKIHNINADFVADMQSLGFKDLSFEELLELKIHNVDKDFVDQLKKAGYTNLSAEQVADAKIHNVSTEYATDMKELGFKELSLEELEELKIHGVSAEYVDELKKAGYTNLSAEEVADAKIHNISTEFAAEMKKLGFNKLTLEELMELKIHGVNANYVALLKEAGYTNLSPEEITDAKIHNVSTEFAAEMKKLGFTKLTLEELMELKIHGINGRYVADLQKAGYSGLSADAITEAKIHNVTPQFAAEMKQLGFTNLSLEELGELKIHGVSSSYVAELKAAGFNNLKAEEVLDAKIHNVNTRFIKEMKEMGYQKESLEDLMDASIHHVTSAYVQSLKKEGLDLNLEEVVEFKIHGISAEFIRQIKGMGMNKLTAEDYLELKIMGIDKKLNKSKEK